MDKNGNLKRFNVNFKPKQVNMLKTIKLIIREESNVNISVSEMVRDAVDHFILETSDDEFRKGYIENKGW
jgi:hypothetical protein